MRFLVIAYGLDSFKTENIEEKALRAHRLRDKLREEGKIIEDAHIAGYRAHMWIYDAESVDELDQLVSGDPMMEFTKSDPLILPLTSYRHMEYRERAIFKVSPEEQTPFDTLASQTPQTKPGESRFLVIAYGRNDLDLKQAGDAPIRANRYREQLMREGKISVHAHIGGQRGHLWIYHVASVDELDQVISNDPMSHAHQADPLILPLCSYQRMHEREEQMFDNR